MAGEERLGDLLVKEGLIDEMQLRSALGHQKRWGGKVGKALVDLGFIEEETMLKFLAERFRMKAVNLARSRIAPQTFQMVPEDVARKYQVVPVVSRGEGKHKTLVLAMSDPSDLRVIDEISFLTGARIEPVLATESAISKVLRSYGHFEPEPAREYHVQETATPVQLKKQEDERKTRQQQERKRRDDEAARDADRLDVQPGEDLEVVEGEVTMLKTKAPSPKTAGGGRQEGTMRMPSSPGRARDVILGKKKTGPREEKTEAQKVGSESPFLIKPGKEEQEPEGPQEIPSLMLDEEPPATPEHVPPETGPEAPSMDEIPQAPPEPDTAGPPDIASAPQVPGPSDTGPPEIPAADLEAFPDEAASPAPDIPGPDVAPGEWFVPPSGGKEALSDEQVEKQKEVEPLDIPDGDKEDGGLELAEMHEFIPPRSYEELMKARERAAAESGEGAEQAPEPEAPPQPGVEPPSLPEEFMSPPEPETQEETEAPSGPPEAPFEAPPSLDISAADVPPLPEEAAPSEQETPVQPEQPEPPEEDKEPSVRVKPPSLDQDAFGGEEQPGEQAPSSDDFWGVPVDEEGGLWGAGPEPAAPGDIPDLPPPPDLGLGEEHPRPGADAEQEKQFLSDDWFEDIDSQVEKMDEQKQPVANLPFEAPPPEEKKETPREAAADQQALPPEPPAPQAGPPDLPPLPEPPSPSGAPFQVESSFSADSEPEDEKLPWEEESQADLAAREEDMPGPAGDMMRIPAAQDESPSIELTREELKKLDDLGDEYLDIREVRQRLQQVASLQQEIKQREYQFDELLNLMMKKELGELTQELFMKELRELKRKADESRNKGGSGQP